MKTVSQYRSQKIYTESYQKKQQFATILLKKLYQKFLEKNRDRVYL